MSVLLLCQHQASIVSHVTNFTWTGNATLQTCKVKITTCTSSRGGARAPVPHSWWRHWIRCGFIREIAGIGGNRVYNHVYNRIWSSGMPVYRQMCITRHLMYNHVQCGITTRVTIYGEVRVSEYGEQCIATHFMCKYTYNHVLVWYNHVWSRGCSYRRTTDTLK